MKSPAVTGYQCVAEAIDAAAFEHQQAVLHDVDLDHAERGAGLVGHGVDGEVEGGLVREQARTWRSGSPFERVEATSSSWPTSSAGAATPASGCVGLFDDGEARAAACAVKVWAAPAGR